MPHDRLLTSARSAAPRAAAAKAALAWTHSARFLTTASQLDQLPTRRAARDRLRRPQQRRQVDRDQHAGAAEAAGLRVEHAGPHPAHQPVRARAQGRARRAVRRPARLRLCRGRARRQAALAAGDGRLPAVRRSLPGVVLMVDSRLGFTELDRQLLALWRRALANGEVKLLVLLTKADKLNRNDAAAALMRGAGRAGRGQHRQRRRRRDAVLGAVATGPGRRGARPCTAGCWRPVSERRTTTRSGISLKGCPPPARKPSADGGRQRTGLTDRGASRRGGTAGLSCLTCACTCGAAGPRCERWLQRLGQALGAASSAGASRRTAQVASDGAVAEQPDLAPLAGPQQPRLDPAALHEHAHPVAGLQAVEPVVGTDVGACGGRRSSSSSAGTVSSCRHVQHAVQRRRLRLAADELVLQLLQRADLAGRGRQPACQPLVQEALEPVERPAVQARVLFGLGRDSGRSCQQPASAAAHARGPAGRAPSRLRRHRRLM